MGQRTDAPGDPRGRLRVALTPASLLAAARRGRTRSEWRFGVVFGHFDVSLSLASPSGL